MFITGGMTTVGTAMGVKYANMTKEEHDAKNVMVVKSANITKEDQNAKNAKEVKYANMGNLKKSVPIATVRIYANQDMIRITQAAGLKGIEAIEDSAHIALPICFQMISKH